MKVVLFCGGLGTRIREYPEKVPKPMIPVGSQPIMLHIMQWYSSYGHRDFVLCLGYKANVIKEFFLNYKPHVFADCVVSRHGSTVEYLGAKPAEWSVSLIDTGIWRNIGERLSAVRSHVQKEDMFLANYSDGLCDVDLNDMVARFKRSGKVACFLTVRPPLTYHLVDMNADGEVRQFVSSSTSDMWINGGYFLMTPKIFDYMQPGEELVEKPFHRLIEKRLLGCYRHTGFWQAMDTFKDKISFDRMEAQGNCPWMLWKNADAPHESSELDAGPF
jgi:glucose-1-phosphate cytidylyltransferase